MFGSKKSPLRIFKHKSTDPGYPVASGSNPFDDVDDELHNKKQVNPTRTSSEPVLKTPNFGSNPFDDDEINGNSSSSSAYARSSADRNKYKNDFHDSGGIENQSVQELENYSVYKAEETTKTVNSCLKIAEDIREDATKTLVTLHHQGEQINRTHMVAADIEQDLSRGEKLLGSLGGMFSKTWKPKKSHTITGPVATTRDDPSAKRISHMEHREKLGLAPPAPRGRSNRTPPPEPTNALEQVEVEKQKQDDGLNDLSDLLGELKEMAVDMGSEIERHNKALDPLYNDVDELNYRVQGTNQRARRLLGK